MRIMLTSALQDKKNKSFTFIELIVVIVIIAILSSLTAQCLRKSFNNLQLKQFGKNFCNLSECLRVRAITQNEICCLLIKATPPREISAAWLDQSGLHMFESRLAKPLRIPKSVRLISIEPSKTEVFFYPDGSSDDLVITFANQDQTTLTLTLRSSTGTLQIN